MIANAQPRGDLQLCIEGKLLIVVADIIGNSQRVIRDPPVRTSEHYAELRRRPHPVADVFTAPDDDRRCTRDTNLLSGAGLPEVSTFRSRRWGIFSRLALSKRACD
jgi:hypothetical protein